MARDDHGYTLVELVLAMMIFSVVMALISVSFSRIVTSSGAIVKNTETDISGLIGLELLRSDLELAGFGLPWSFPNTNVHYLESPTRQMVPGFPGSNAAAYNDVPPDAPRAYQSGDGAGFNGSDYLVLRGSAVGMSRVARSWRYLNYSSTGTIEKQSKSGYDLEPNKGQRAIVLRSIVNSGVATRELVTPAPGSSAFTLTYDYPLDSRFLPKSRLDNYLVYGVAEEPSSGEGAPLLFPFNRADYYISPSGDHAATCADHTGILYKTTLDHNGRISSWPTLDCVADLQVVFMMETSNDGTLVPHSGISAFDAAQLRELLKEVRLYVMAQQGKLDAGYHFPVIDPENVITVGDRRWTRSEFLGKGWEHYHWKVYSIVVQPKNL